MAALDETSLLSKLDSVAPLAQFDAFPKLPSTYKSRSESRGFMTLFVALMAVLLVLNDVGEYIWGWPDYEFSVDNNHDPFLNINLDMVIAMPCAYISVDLRDAMGDRLFLTGGFRRDGTFFDVGQATALREHSAALSARQAVAQSRKSRGVLSWLFSRNKPLFKPTYKYTGAEGACRITGTLAVKRVTANLHITTLGHGYASYEHVDHNKMNLSHIITEFSFGPHFPDIVQPLDNSFEATDKHFIAYQYFLHVVPTTYIAPRSAPLHTHQYAVTHYTREVEHDRGTPGIFFKFDLDPLSITLHQRTTTFLQLLIRTVGVLGGVFVCMGYAIRITTRAVEVVSGADAAPGIVAAESSGVRLGLRSKWAGGELRSRNSGKLVPQGNGWTMEGTGGSAGGSPYGSYTGTPVTPAFTPAGLSPYSPQMSLPGSPSLGGMSAFGPPPTPGGGRSGLVGPPRTPATGTLGGHTPSRSISGNGVSAYGNGNGAGNGYGNGGAYAPSPTLSDVGLPPASSMPPPTPGVGYATFPASPAPGSAGFQVSAPPPMRKGPSSGKKDD